MNMNHPQTTYGNISKAQPSKATSLRGLFFKGYFWLFLYLSTKFSNFIFFYISRKKCVVVYKLLEEYPVFVRSSLQMFLETTHGIHNTLCDHQGPIILATLSSLL